MRTDEFDYYLPEELIAQTPLENRSSSRLLVLHKKTGHKLVPHELCHQPKLPWLWLLIFLYQKKWLYQYHFTEELLKEIKDKGIEVVHVTLHVGLGTFRPVQVDNILEHKMHKESYILDEKTTEVLNHIQKNGGKNILHFKTSLNKLVYN